MDLSISTREYYLRITMTTVIRRGMSNNIAKLYAYSYFLSIPSDLISTEGRSMTQRQVDAVDKHFTKDGWCYGLFDAAYFSTPFPFLVKTVVLYLPADIHNEEKTSEYTFEGLSRYELHSFSGVSPSDMLEVIAKHYESLYSIQEVEVCLTPVLRVGACGGDGDGFRVKIFPNKSKL